MPLCLMPDMRDDTKFEIRSEDPSPVSNLPHGRERISASAPILHKNPKVLQTAFPPSARASFRFHPAKRSHPGFPPRLPRQENRRATWPPGAAGAFAAGGSGVISALRKMVRQQARNDGSAGDTIDAPHPDC